MHAASVYPEPGSNSPKETRSCGRDFKSEGLIRCAHSELEFPTTLQLSRCSARHGGPRRRVLMMGLDARRVKRAGPLDDRARRPAARRQRLGGAPLGSGARADGSEAPEGLSNSRGRRARAPPGGQIGLSWTSRTNAAPESQASSAELHRRRGAQRSHGHQVDDQADERGEARLGESQQDLEDELAHARPLGGPGGPG